MLWAPTPVAKEGGSDTWGFMKIKWGNVYENIWPYTMGTHWTSFSSLGGVIAVSH